LIFDDASENLVTANDANMSLNPLIAPVKEEELGETPYDVNVL
jgi:hypothetical protein